MSSGVTLGHNPKALSRVSAGQLSAHSSSNNARRLFGSMDQLSREDPKRAIRVRVAAILLSNNLNLLAALCQSTFVGDTAANIANSIIALLRQITEDSSDQFVKRILSTKIFIYSTVFWETLEGVVSCWGVASKGRKIADLLRDNSMSTIMLTSITKNFGSEYLKATLKDTLTRVGEYITLEDASQLPASSSPTLADAASVKTADNTSSPTSPASPDSTAANTASGSQTLAVVDDKVIRAATEILEAIIGSADQMPREFRQLCRYLHVEIVNRNIDDILAWKPDPESLTPAQDISAPPTETRSSRKPSLGSIFDHGSDKSILARLGMRRKSKQMSTPNLAGTPLGSQQLDASGRSLPPAVPSKDTAPDVPSKDSTPDVPSKDPTPTGSPPSLNAPRLFTQPSPVPEESVLHTASVSLKGESPISSSSGRERAPIKVSVTDPQLSTRDTLNQPGEDSFLTDSERVVGTLIFLRFFVPAVTAPEGYGVLTFKLNKIGRKRLIQVGKILNAFFSEVDARQKEPGTMGFIEKHKYDVRMFVNSVTREPGRSKTSSIRQTQRPSIQEVVEEKAQKQLIETDEALLVNLSRSVDRIQRDLEVHVRSVPAEESSGVISGLRELKHELESYDRILNQPKNPSFMYRLKQRFNAVMGRQPKARSVDDLTLTRPAKTPQPKSANSVNT